MGQRRRTMFPMSDAADHRRLWEPARSALTAATVIEAWAAPGGRWDAAVELIGATLLSPVVAGEWVLLGAGSAELAVHLGSAGVLEVVSGVAPQRAPALRASWNLRDVSGTPLTLTLCDPLGFSRLTWVDNAARPVAVSQAPAATGCERAAGSEPLRSCPSLLARRATDVR